MGVDMITKNSIVFLKNDETLCVLKEQDLENCHDELVIQDVPVEKFKNLSLEERQAVTQAAMNHLWGNPSNWDDAMQDGIEAYYMNQRS